MLSAAARRIYEKTSRAALDGTKTTDFRSNLVALADQLTALSATEQRAILAMLGEC